MSKKELYIVSTYSRGSSFYIIISEFTKKRYKYYSEIGTVELKTDNYQVASEFANKLYFENLKDNENTFACFFDRS